MGLFDFAATAQKDANTRATHEQRSKDWVKWEEFCDRFGITSDRYLVTFSPLGKQAILGAFASFIRQALYKGSRSEKVATGTVRRALGNVSQGFKSAGHPDPRLDVDGKICFRLTQICKGFEKNDPKKKHQKAIPISVLKQVLRLAHKSNNDFNIAIAHLAIGAYSFAMRSCEYSKTCFDEESKLTKVLRVRNVRFFLGRQLLDHSDKRIFIADYVNITFEWQKNEDRDNSVSMHGCRRYKTREFDPVFIWATIISKVRAYPGKDDVNDRKVNSVMDNGKIKEISSFHLRTKLRAAVVSVGEDVLGFKASDIGCHSLRSGAAMAMKLAGVSEFTIMIIGRWQSMAFLDYIRKQVAQFSINITDQMLQHADFYTTQDFKQTSNSPRTVHENFNGGANDWGVFKPILQEC